MRRTVAAALVASTLLTAAAAWADDPPPPPPPPPAESGSGESSGGSSPLRQPDGLFDTSSGHHRPMLISAFIGLPYGYYGYWGGFGLGFGARFYLPLVHDGFIPQINDEFGIEFGADLSPSFGTYNYFFLDIPVQVMLDVHVTPQFDAYAKVGIAPTLYFGYSSGFYVPSLFAGAVGLRYKLGSSFYLRAEAGYPMLMVGVGFGF